MTRLPPPIKLPRLTDKLIETGEEVKYRSFSVAEEKILLLAEETKDPIAVFDAIEDILDLCVVSHDARKLPVFECEKLLMLIRAASVDSIVSLNVRDPQSEEYVKIEFTAESMIIEKPSNHTKEIKVSDEMTILMRYPTMSDMKSVLTQGVTKKMTVDAVLNCIDKVIEGDEVFEMNDIPMEEKLAWIDGLPKVVLVAMKTFMETMPFVKYVCPFTRLDGSTGTLTLKGLETFFD